MIFAVAYADQPARVAMLARDLGSSGLSVSHQTPVLATLAEAIQQHRPDVLVCALAQADASFFAVTRAIADLAPCAVLVFPGSVDLDGVAAAAEASVHGYALEPYDPARLALRVQLAQARFKHEQTLRTALDEALQALQERKVVDRAKTILMRVRQLSDDDAFRLMRTASMHSNHRLADVSQHIIRSALFAEGVNRAGQLRMLSQRLVKLCACLHLLAGQVPAAEADMKNSVDRIDANLIWLQRNFSTPAHSQRLGQVAATWRVLKRAVGSAPQPGAFRRLDDLAEMLLQHAEGLTGELESGGGIAPLQVLNLAGRQRMLSQRFAKHALLGALGDADLARRCQAAMAISQADFEKAQHELNNIPLNTPDTRHGLGAARQGWQALLAGVAEANHAEGQRQLLHASEALLEVFEQLSSHYESSLQMLVG